MSDKPMSWQPHWTAALRKHKMLIAAGCISPVAAKRVAPGKAKDEEQESSDEAKN